MSRPAVAWLLLGVLVLAQIGYPLIPDRAPLVVVTVVLGYTASVVHAVVTRGARAGAALVGATTIVGLLVEALGVHTGYPFGGYGYASSLGPGLLGVPLVIPLAWTWMAWPAWIAAGVLARRWAHRTALRISVAGFGLAAWDLFLDPQMVAEGYWHWTDPRWGLPGVPAIPLTNYLGWLIVATLMMALFGYLAGPQAAGRSADAPMLALYLWTYGSSVLAHAVFLHLPASAAWGALGMGLVAVPLAAVCAVMAWPVARQSMAGRSTAGGSAAAWPAAVGRRRPGVRSGQPRARWGRSRTRSRRPTAPSGRD